MRFWRNTSVATLGAGQVATLAAGTIGAEFDVDEDNGFRPAGLVELSNTPITDSVEYLLDYGSTYGAGTAVHKLTLYKAPSGAWVFAAGTYQWSWGLDSNHDRSNLGATTDIRMQQATVNLFADMGVQPSTLQAGLDSSNGVKRCNRSNLDDYSADRWFELATGKSCNDHRYCDRYRWCSRRR